MCRSAHVMVVQIAKVNYCSLGGVEGLYRLLLFDGEPVPKVKVSSGRGEYRRVQGRIPDVAKLRSKERSR